MQKTKDELRTEVEALEDLALELLFGTDPETTDLLRRRAAATRVLADQSTISKAVMVSRTGTKRK